MIPIVSQLPYKNGHTGWRAACFGSLTLANEHEQWFCWLSTSHFTDLWPHGARRVTQTGTGTRKKRKPPPSSPHQGKENSAWEASRGVWVLQWVSSGASCSILSAFPGIRLKLLNRTLTYPAEAVQSLQGLNTHIVKTHLCSFSRSMVDSSCSQLGFLAVAMDFKLDHF